MEGGYMLGNIISLVILLVMMFALCYMGFKRNEYKYHMRGKKWMKENLERKND